MPTLKLVTELSISDLLTVVSAMSDAELAQFEAGLANLKQTRTETQAQQATAMAQVHRLEPDKEAQLATLLHKNREGRLTPCETEKLDSLLAESDERLMQTADSLHNLKALNLHPAQTQTD
jgi:hypothetical protein